MKRIASNIFNVDLYTDHAESLLRSFKLADGPRPAPHITWCLEKVLSYLQTIHTEANGTLKTGKCAFLLQLALGCRISELTSLSRNLPFMHFLPGGQVRITPDSRLLQRHKGSGLKKHERCDKLDQPIIIHPLFLADGKTSSPLCPIHNLKMYMDTPSDPSDTLSQLFVHHASGKSLTISQLRKYIVTIIRNACPNSFPKTHDIRKVASSVSLLSNMTLDEISKRTGWSQAKTFWTHYNVSIKNLRSQCVTMGERNSLPRM